MSIDTQQLFSVNSGGYAAARPHYPRKLFEFLISQCPDTECAWDCGTGSGQAAVALAEWFAQVQATDVSPQQIASAAPHAKVHYSVQSAEECRFADRQFSLVTVAQALHWFDLPRFWPQVQRVLRPGGVFAAWTYTTLHLSPTLDSIIEQQLLKPIDPYWAPHNQLAREGYRSIVLPFAEIPVPPITMNLEWNLPQVIAYLQTWSATRRRTEENGPGYFNDFRSGLERAWGDPQAVKTVRMEFFCRAGRHAG